MHDDVTRLEGSMGVVFKMAASSASRNNNGGDSRAAARRSSHIHMQALRPFKFSAYGKYDVM